MITIKNISYWSLEFANKVKKYKADKNIRSF